MQIKSFFEKYSGIILGVTTVLFIPVNGVYGQTQIEDFNQECHQDPRVWSNLVSHEVCVGSKLFFEETFEGNGRTCATCHRVENNYTIDPLFVSQLPESDPLFIAENSVELSGLEVEDALHDLSLIKVNIDGFQDNDSRFVLRSAPHLLSLATSLERDPTTYRLVG